VDSGGRSADAGDSLDTGDFLDTSDSFDVGDFLDASDSFDAGDSLDTSDSFDAGDSLDTGVEPSALVGTWEGELMFYSSDGVLASATPTTIEFTDAGIYVFVVGMLIKFLYSIDTDQTPPHLNVELFDPERTLPSPYVLPTFYKINDGILTLGLSFFSLQLQTSGVEEQHFPMVFELVRVP